LRHRFTIARGSTDTKPVIIVLAEYAGITGIGEAAPISRYGETADSVRLFPGKVNPEKFEDPFRGVKVVEGTPALPERPGVGVLER
jgi:L-alanine-DL-glutamate epimerase-like enolase superfamily enzyme